MLFSPVKARRRLKDGVCMTAWMFAAPKSQIIRLLNHLHKIDTLITKQIGSGIEKKANHEEYCSGAPCLTDC